MFLGAVELLEPTTVVVLWCASVSKDWSNKSNDADPHGVLLLFTEIPCPCGVVGEVAVEAISKNFLALLTLFP